MVIIFQSCPRNLLQHGTGHMKSEELWGTMRNPKAQNYTTDSWGKNKNRGRKKENWEENKDGKTTTTKHVYLCFLWETVFPCEVRECVSNAETLVRWEASLVSTHTFYSSSVRWWQHEINITTAESATGGSHEGSLIFSHQRDTWFILFSRKADNAPMKISGGFHHHYCSPHTIFKCILDYVAM